MMFRRNLKILLASNMLWALGAGMLGPLFAVFTESIGGDVFDISWAWATYLIVTGALVIFIGKLSDTKVSKEKLLIAGLAVTTIFTFGFLLVSQPVHLLFVQAGLGIGLALSWPTWDALYSEYEDRKNDGFEWGLADGAEYLVTGIAILIGGAIVTYLSFKHLFIIMGFVQLAGTIVQSFILKKK